MRDVIYKFDKEVFNLEYVRSLTREQCDILCERHCHNAMIETCCKTSVEDFLNEYSPLCYEGYYVRIFQEPDNDTTTKKSFLIGTTFLSRVVVDVNEKGEIKDMDELVEQVKSSLINKITNNEVEENIDEIRLDLEMPYEEECNSIVK